MGRIVYSVAGEGRGHAARARALTSVLSRRHDVRLYAAGQAYDMLCPLYGRGQDPRVEVRRLSGMEFRYGAGKRLDYIQSLVDNMPFLWSMADQAAFLAADINRFGADLVISDFEPLVSRAAANSGVPFITLDHQTFLVSCDLGRLPAALQGYAAFMSPFVKAFYPAGRVLGLVSSFFEAPMRAEARDVRQIGCLLRPEVREAKSEIGSHLVAYLRRDFSDSVIEALVALNMEVRVYGIGVRPSREAVRFCEVDAIRFVDDLASARGLVCTAGNQLIGEAIHLRKPVLAMPERGNFEQQINGYFVREVGAGMVVDMDELNVAHLRAFCSRLPAIRARQGRLSADGTAQALAWVEGLLEHPVYSFQPVPEHPPLPDTRPFVPAASALLHP